MSSAGAAPRAAVPVSNARAAASRKNGAKSRGPKSPEGKARSARNALKHGLRAEKYLVLLHEDGGEFARLEAALVAELAPEGALQSVLARRVARAAWRLIRADRLEAEVFAERSYGAASPGLALIRDGNGTRSIETLLRYRGAAMAELTRALRTLKALQAEARAHAAAGVEAPVRPRAVAPVAPAVRLGRSSAPRKKPNEPKSRGNPGDPARPGDRSNPGRVSDPSPARISPLPPPMPGASARRAQPIEPETRHPGGSAPPAMSNEARPAQSRLAP
jgi:hypothetical protein